MNWTQTKSSIEFEYRFFNYESSFRFSKFRILSKCVTSSSTSSNSRSTIFRFTNVFMSEIQIQSSSVNFITIDTAELNKNSSTNVLSIVIKYKSSIVSNESKVFDEFKIFEKIVSADVNYEEKFEFNKRFHIDDSNLFSFIKSKKRKKRKKSFSNKLNYSQLSKCSTKFYQNMRFSYLFNRFLNRIKLIWSEWIS